MNPGLVDENLALQRRVLALGRKGPGELQTRLTALAEQVAALRDPMFGASSETRASPSALRERPQLRTTARAGGVEPGATEREALGPAAHERGPRRRTAPHS